MKLYKEMSREELSEEKASLEKAYEGYKAMGLSLNMARGKPGAEQLDISMPMLDVLNSSSDCTDEGTDCRNYGILDGIPGVKKMFADILGLPVETSDVRELGELGAAMTAAVNSFFLLGTIRIGNSPPIIL